MEDSALTSHFLISSTVSQSLHSSFIKFLAKKYTVDLSVQLDIASKKIIAGGLSWIIEKFQVNIVVHKKHLQ